MSPSQAQQWLDNHRAALRVTAEQCTSMAEAWPHSAASLLAAQADCLSALRDLEGVSVVQPQEPGS